ncbi:class I adenylate-forming enzyme family protein [Paenibacillus tarimensis]
MELQQFLHALGTHRGPCILLDNGGQISYEAIWEAAEFNAGLLRKAVRGGTAGRLIMLLDISLGWKCVPLLLAAFKLRAVTIPVDPGGRPHLFRSIRARFPESILIGPEDVNASGKMGYSPAPSLQAVHSAEWKDTGVVLFTSGSSGTPKGVMLSFRNILSNVQSILLYYPLGRHDKVWISRPLTTPSAITGELLTALASGSSVYISQGRSPLTAVKQIETLGLTRMCTTPTLAALIAGKHTVMNISSLRTVVLSGEVLHEGLYGRISSQMSGVRVWNAYGMTEASPRISCYTGDTPFTSGCVGFPLHDVSVRIVDEQGQELPDGEQGELIVRGPNIMQGYLDNPELTNGAIRNGWLYTGDSACVVKGRIIIAGRRDQMMIRGGENVYPEEIQGVILGCPGVAGVQVRQDQKDRRIHAIVAAAGEVSEGELFRYIRLNADSRLWPDRISVVESLVPNTAGKTRRR